MRTLHPSWPPQGQRARGSGTSTPHHRSLLGLRKPQALCLLGAQSSPGTEAGAGVVGIMASRAEPKKGTRRAGRPLAAQTQPRTEGRLDWQKGAGPDGPAPTSGLLHSHPPGQSCSHLPCAPIATPPTHHRAFENKGEVPPQQELGRDPSNKRETQGTAHLPGPTPPQSGTHLERNIWVS